MRRPSHFCPSISHAAWLNTWRRAFKSNLNYNFINFALIPMYSASKWQAVPESFIFYQLWDWAMVVYRCSYVCALYGLWLTSNLSSFDWVIGCYPCAKTYEISIYNYPISTDSAIRTPHLKSWRLLPSYIGLAKSRVTTYYVTSSRVWVATPRFKHQADCLYVKRGHSALPERQAS